MFFYCSEISVHWAVMRSSWICNAKSSMRKVCQPLHDIYDWINLNRKNGGVNTFSTNMTFFKMILNTFDRIYFRNLFHFPIMFPNLISPKEGVPKRSRKDCGLTAPKTDSFVDWWQNVPPLQFQYLATWALGQQLPVFCWAPRYFYHSYCRSVYPTGLLVPGSDSIQAWQKGRVVLSAPEWLRNTPASAQQSHFHILSLERGPAALPGSSSSPSIQCVCSDTFKILHQGDFNMKRGETWGKLKLFFFLSLSKCNLEWFTVNFTLFFYE